MSRFSLKIIVAGLALVVGIFSVVGWISYRQSQKVDLQIPKARWEPIFFKLINQTTELSGHSKLREQKIDTDDVEVRIWRGFGLGKFEGVILKRASNQWEAYHLKADDYTEPQNVTSEALRPPKSGWQSFWGTLAEKGLLVLRDPSETGCEDPGIDGTGYVVEINQNGVYRTYAFREDGKCPGVRQMEAIDDFIGEEFDSGQEECKSTEWFACAKIRKSHR